MNIEPGQLVAQPGLQVEAVEPYCPARAAFLDGIVEHRDRVPGSSQGIDAEAVKPDDDMADEAMLFERSADSFGPAAQ